MSFFDGLLVNTVFILFPLLVYLIYVTYKKNVEEEYDDLMFELMLFTSLYLIMRHGYGKDNTYIEFLINIPLLFAFIKGKTSLVISISIMLILYFTFFTNYNFIFVFLEYLIYFIIYVYGKILQKEDTFYIDYITIFKSFIFSFSVMYFLRPDSSVIDNLKTIVISVLLFYVCANVYYKLIKKSKEIMSLNSIIKDLEKEKTVQKSLFKITHEIKNPIAVCKGYLDMIDNKNTKKNEKYIDIIRGEIARTLMLMDDFLDYSRIKLNMEILDINMLISDTCISMKPLFNEKKIVTKFNSFEDELYVEGDYNRLKQVIINILKNSFESKTENRKLKIEVDTKRIEDSVYITIKDNGCGIKKEQLDKIGEAFFTTKSNGTGLGICLSKEIIKKHRGSIDYNSEFNAGTEVIISLPLYKLN